MTNIRGTLYRTLKAQGCTEYASLISQIASDLGLAFDGGPVEIHRVYAGRWQLADGAWSWFLTDAKGKEIVGSHASAATCIKAWRAGSDGLVVLHRHLGIATPSMDVTLF